MKILIDTNKPEQVAELLAFLKKEETPTKPTPEARFAELIQGLEIVTNKDYPDSEFYVKDNELYFQHDKKNNMNEFEKYPELANHIERMAQSGKVGTGSEWGSFCHELNKTLKQLPKSSELTDFAINAQFPLPSNYDVSELTDGGKIKIAFNDGAREGAKWAREKLYNISPLLHYKTKI